MWTWKSKELREALAYQIRNSTLVGNGKTESRPKMCYSYATD